jgi:hypothetical protein
MPKAPKGLQESSNFNDHVSVLDHCGYRNVPDHAKKNWKEELVVRQGLANRT